MYNPFTLQGKTILVTGASSGIGKSIAIQCSQYGASVVITGRNQERLQETLDLINIEETRQHLAFSADLNSDEQILKLASNVPCLDGLVLCSGINDKAPIKYVTRDKIEKVYNANVYGPILLVRELIRQKKINKGASVVFISSISSIYATISNALYASSKGAINSLVKVLALELSSKRIRVNSIMPGMVRTGINNTYELSDEEIDSVIKSYPLGRIGETEDIANAAIYFLSDASSWVTGANLVIDGGVTLR
ncbi:MAG: SDR family oxidoreductase [archaeon]|nr:SDR family oxidoreductase [archaeon]